MTRFRRRKTDLPRVVAAGLFFVSVFMLGGCGTVQPMVPPARETLRLDVPFFDQQTAYCGPATLASTLHYYQRPTTMETLVREVYLPGREGSLALEMAAALRRHGLVPYPLAASLDDLLRELDAGHPVVVLQNLGLSWWPQWHYALVVGYQRGGERLLLHSGKTPYYVLPSGTFMRTWARSDYWARVAVPLERIPATARDIPYLNALDAMAQTRTATAEPLRAALAGAVERWPESASARFALANALLEAGEHEKSVAHYLHGLKRQPRSPLAWNNLAFALKAGGCGEAAATAMARALALAPDDSRLQASAAEIGEADDTRANCPDIPVLD